VTGRLTFLSHFILCLACTGVSFFAYQRGVFQTIYASDMSMMTSVIAAIFVGTAIYFGKQAWVIDSSSADEAVYIPAPDGSTIFRRIYGPSADVGHLAERLCVMAGFVGTAIGLSMQAKALAGGATSFTALATSLFTTASGGTAAALIAIMTFSLECGIKRARR
jgi:hypothetical protein